MEASLNMPFDSINGSYTGLVIDELIHLNSSVLDQRRSLHRAYYYQSGAQMAADALEESLDGDCHPSCYSRYTHAMRNEVVSSKRDG